MQTKHNIAGWNYNVIAKVIKLSMFIAMCIRLVVAANKRRGAYDALLWG